MKFLWSVYNLRIFHIQHISEGRRWEFLIKQKQKSNVYKTISVYAVSIK